MRKYLLYIVIGILIFLITNYYEGFNIGAGWRFRGQPRGTSASGVGINHRLQLVGGINFNLTYVFETIGDLVRYFQRYGFCPEDLQVCDEPGSPSPIEEDEDAVVTFTEEKKRELEEKEKELKIPEGIPIECELRRMARGDRNQCPAGRAQSWKEAMERDLGQINTLLDELWPDTDDDVTGLGYNYIVQIKIKLRDLYIKHLERINSPDEYRTKYVQACGVAMGLWIPDDDKFVIEQFPFIEQYPFNPRGAISGPLGNNYDDLDEPEAHDEPEALNSTDPVAMTDEQDTLHAIGKAGLTAEQLALYRKSQAEALRVIQMENTATAVNSSIPMTSPIGIGLRLLTRGIQGAPLERILEFVQADLVIDLEMRFVNIVISIIRQIHNLFRDGINIPYGQGNRGWAAMRTMDNQLFSGLIDGLFRIIIDYFMTRDNVQPLTFTLLNEVLYNLFNFLYNGMNIIHVNEENSSYGWKHTRDYIRNFPEMIGRLLELMLNQGLRFTTKQVLDPATAVWEQVFVVIIGGTDHLLINSYEHLVTRPEDRFNDLGRQLVDIINEIYTRYYPTRQ